MSRIERFLDHFEELSKENAKHFAGLPHDTVFELYNLICGPKEDACVFKAVWGNLARDRFGKGCFSQYKCRISKRKLNYCKLQPKNPSLWMYLWAIPRPIMEATCPTSEDVGPTSQNRNTNNDHVDLVGAFINDEREDDSGGYGEDEDAISSDDDVGSEYGEDEDAHSSEDVSELVTPPSKKRKNEQSRKGKTLFMDLPDLDSEAMRKYSLRQLQNAPSWIRDWLDSKGFAAGLKLDGYPPHFITKDVRKELQQNGFAVIKGVFDLSLLKEATRYIEIKQRSERIDIRSYEKLCRQRHTVGLVTKNGWTKTDYVGYAQQVITASPNLYTCLSELYGTSRLFPNLYEYKYNFGRSSNANDEFEFVHADVNYSKLLFAEQVGLPIDEMYQFITPLTPMSPETTTVYLSKGFHRHWKAATYRAMKHGHWTRHGWQACSPFKQFLSEDVEKLIEPTLTPLRADPGDLIIFAATLPHGPNLNSTSALRIAAYPYLAPRLDFGEETSKPRSYLPNDIDSITDSIQFAACPVYSAHAACKYKLSRISRQFFPCLPYRELRRSLLGDYLFGFKSSKEFENSKFAKYLFGPTSPERTAVIEVTNELMTSELCSWNDEMEKLLTIHEDHSVGEDPECSLCNRITQATLEQWWHSTDAVYHLLIDCCCVRCKRVKQLGWKHWKDSNGCTCTVCVDK